MPAEGGTARQLTDGDWNHSTGEWTPDGAELVFSSLRTEDAELAWRQSKVYTVEIASGGVRQLTRRNGQDFSPLPSPRGDLIAYRGSDWHDDTYRNAGIYVMERDGGSPRLISGDFDRSINGMQWAADGSGLYLTVSSEGTRNLHFASVSGGVEAISEGEHMFALSSFAADGQAVGTCTSPSDPSDIVGFDLDDANRREQLTRVNDDVLGGVTFGEVEEVWYESVEDFDIQGWIIHPPDFDPNKEYPLMLAIHGGPHGMYNVGFNFGWQEHAANGYVVLYTNPRGSSGYAVSYTHLTLPTILLV